MSTDEATKTLTAEEFQKLPDEGSYRMELVRGMVVRSPGPGFMHGKVEVNVVLVLGEFVRRHRLGDVLCGDASYVVERGPDTVRGPDVSFVRAGRFPGRRYPVGYPEGGPDLAIEILSPSNRPGEVRERMEDLLRGGCREFWVLDPRRRTVTVRTPDGPEAILSPDDELTTPLLPGFRCQVRDFYRYD